MDVVRHLMIHGAPDGAPYFILMPTYSTAADGGGAGPSRYVQKDYFDIVICLSGSSRTVGRDPHGVERPIEMRAGTILFGRPQEQRWLTPQVTSVEPTRIFLLGFRPQDWRTFASLVGADSARLTGSEPVIGEAAEDPAMWAAIEEISRRVDAHPDVLDLVRFWAAVIGHVLPTTADRRGTAPVWLLDAVATLRSDETALRAGGARLRELAHVGTRHLSRLTRRWFDRDPRQLVEDLRIQHARRLLLETDESVTRISERCGFVSPAYFSGRFRRATGVSPRAFRDRALRVPEIAEGAR